MIITRYDVVHKQDLLPSDQSALLDGTTNQEIMQIPTSFFGTDVTMYKIVFGVVQTDPLAPDVDDVTVICSNVNFVYANLIDLVMNLTNCCISDADYASLDRNHMILYAHQEAMRLERYSEATYFYDIIWNLFSNCRGSARQNGVTNNPCDNSVVNSPCNTCF